ncbi:MAG TPA: hypothetical protein VGQ77_14890 [Methylomirabilota bacterium]|jgi:hypothetical protein|nr:hypothetical protein [Methylomirabilota bacterium]
MVNRRVLDTAIATTALLVITGCASMGTVTSTTRTASFGPLAGGGSLVTLVVTEDLNVVRRECADVPAKGQILGCHIARPVATAGLLPVRAMKIVRYAETAPSPATFEIDAHELCHAVAALQFMKDPCHDGNGGVLQAQETAGAGVAIQRSLR